MQKNPPKTNIGPGNVLLPNSNFIILASDENWNLTVYHKNWVETRGFENDTLSESKVMYAKAFSC